MKILGSFILVLGGIGLYLFLLRLGIYRLYPVETYAAMGVGVWLALTAARSDGGWWRYTVTGLHGLLLVFILYWTLSYSKLPRVSLGVSVGEELPEIALTDADEVSFSSHELKGKTAALYIFYRGDW